MTLSAIRADITALDVDAIVNAANERLAQGGGVCGAIFRAAGEALLARACAPLAPCPTGQARITPGFALPARFVIHAVGPVWHGGEAGEAALLAACYRHSLRLAREHGIASIAFPAISCGVYGYPIDQAAAIAVHETRAWLAEGAAPLRIVLCCFGSAVTEAYRAAYESACRQEQCDDRV